MTKPEKGLWTLFLLFAAVVIFGIFGLFSDGVFNFLVTCIPLILLFLHASWAFGVKRGLAFILLAGAMGFAAEAISLNHGTLFGGGYTYKPTASLLHVPLAVVSYWAIFIYLGYWLVTTFEYWVGRQKPGIKIGSLSRLAFLVIADGLAVTAIDLFMDPVKVKTGDWSWMNGGAYFGVPIGNFVGWFCVTAFVTGLFRLFEYYRPRKEPSINSSLYVIPAVGLLLIGINFLVGAISYNLPGVALIGTLIVIMPALANIALRIQFFALPIYPNLKHKR